MTAGDSRARGFFMSCERHAVACRRARHGIAALSFRLLQALTAFCLISSASAAPPPLRVTSARVRPNASALSNAGRVEVRAVFRDESASVRSALLADAVSV